MHVGLSLAIARQIRSVEAGAAKAAGEKRGTQSQQEPHPPDEMVILMRLYGFDVPFSVATERLVEVADGFAQTARILSADPSRRN